MKYYAEVDGESHEVELALRPGTHELEVRLDGEPVEVACHEVDRLGQVALLVGGRSYAVSVEEEREDVLVSIAGIVHRVRVEDERERAARAADRARRAGGGDVAAVMPGVVVEVLVAEGERVEEGQALLVLEAMKMQNEIAAPRAGVVERVHVSRGQAIASGAKLATLSAE